jgi:hypothetical protein
VNIIEAVKSGKPFKRKKWDGWVRDRYEGFTISDVMSEDWEIQERKIELTESQIRKALRTQENHHYVDAVVKELGFL